MIRRHLDEFTDIDKPVDISALRVSQLEGNVAMYGRVV